MVKKHLAKKSRESTSKHFSTLDSSSESLFLKGSTRGARGKISNSFCRIERHFCRIARHSSQLRRSTIKSNPPVSLVLPYSSCANFGLQRCTERYCERIPASASARLESVMTVYLLMLDVRMVEEIHENRLSLKVWQKFLDYEELFPSFYVSWNYRWLWSFFPERNQ